MTDQKRRILQCATGAVVFITAIFFPKDHILRSIPFILAYLIAGYDVLIKAASNIANRRFFDEYLLMAIATIGAICLKEYPEAVAVMLFYQIGRLFQDYAVERSRKSITALMDMVPECASVERNGEILQVDPEEIEVGEILHVRPGEKIPLDGVVIEGSASLNTAALTGESVPRVVSTGGDALSGCINLDGFLKIKVAKEFDDSTVSKILELVEIAGSKKAKTEQFITKFAYYYTPIVVLMAIVLATIPPLIIGTGEFYPWIERALIFLVISCPCALVLSIPLSYFGGIGGASKCGILVKGGNYLEALSSAKTVVFDKTGTLTQGEFEVKEIKTYGMNNDNFLELLAHTESISNHPVALSILKAYSKPLNSNRISEAKELPGYGIFAKIDGFTSLAGNAALLKKNDINLPRTVKEDDVLTTVHFAYKGIYCGCVVLADKIKQDTQKTVSGLKALGVEKTIMLTGDKQSVAENVAHTIGIDTYYAELLPGDKVSKVEALLSKSGGKLVFVGDGINDAPVLMRADVGIAMGAMGSDAAIEAADIVLLDDNPYRIVTAIKIAKTTMSIVHQNVVFALGVKFLVLGLGALGFANMWMAVFSDVGVSVIAVLNATRTLSTKKFL